MYIHVLVHISVLRVNIILRGVQMGGHKTQVLLCTLYMCVIIMCIVHYPTSFSTDVDSTVVSQFGSLIFSHPFSVG